MMKKLLVILTLILCFAQAHAGKYAAEYLSIGVGARALAMGGAFVAVADDASATYWNPAGLVQLRQREVHFMHASRFSNMVQTDVLNVVYPGGNFAAGLNYIRMGIDDIPFTKNLNAAGRPEIEKYISDTEEAMFLSFGAQAKKFSLGGNLKVLRQRIGDDSSLGFGFDFGAFYTLNSSLSFGAIIQDISGTHIYWNAGHRDTKTPNLKYGAAYKKSFLFLRSQLLFSVQQDIRFEGQSYSSQIEFGDVANADFQIGADYQMLDILALRLGSNAGELTAGAGLGFKMLRIDYAFMSYELGNAHRVSASIRF